MSAFPKLEAKTFKSFDVEIDGISKKTMEEHYKLYKAYVSKTNEIREKLDSVDRSTANQTYSDLRSLKVDYTFALGGVKNHEIYFEILGGKGGKPEGELAEMIDKHFGSFDAYVTDLKQTGLAARGWVWTAYDWEDGSLFNYIGDAQNTFPIWNATPLVALDTYEHAYFIDHGAARAPYIDAFLKTLDWSAVARIAETSGVLAHAKTHPQTARHTSASSELGK